MTPWERVRATAVLPAAVAVGYVELHATEVSATLGVVTVFGLLAGFGSPRLFWACALVLGAAVPASYGVAALLRIAPRELPQPERPLTYVTVGAFTIAVAFVASALGAALARAASRG